MAFFGEQTLQHSVLIQCDKKSDGYCVDKETLDHFVKEHNFCGWLYTSAKDNINVEESVKYLVENVCRIDDLLS